MKSSTDPFASGDRLIARRRATKARVEFAAVDGTCDTLEGPVSYKAGDALVTGIAGERYPVRRASFFQLYRLVSPAEPCTDGEYVRRSTRVRVIRANAPQSVVLDAQGNTAHATAGDWIVDHENGDRGVVRSGLFERTYTMELRWRLRDLPLKALSWLYQRYMHGMHALGTMLRREARPRNKEDSAANSPDDDERARMLGNAYRGIGVFNGMLGICVVAMTVLPQARDLDGYAAMTYSALLLLLALLVALFRIKEKWIRTRMRAEKHRYRHLAALVESTDDAALAALDAELGFLVGTAGLEEGHGSGAGEDQAAYNRQRQGQFESILRGAKMFNRIMMILSVLFAGASVAFSFPWFAALALAMSGLAGAVQGINGFLRLQERALEHAQLASRLEALDIEYRRATQAPEKRRIAGQILAALTTDTQQWQRVTRTAHDLF